MTEKLRADTLARMENARRDDCLDRMVPSDLRILLGDTLRLLDEIDRLRAERDAAWKSGAELPLTEETPDADA